MVSEERKELWTHIEPDRVPCLGRRVPELEEVVRKLGRTGHLTRALETEDEEIEDETVVLEDERRELETTNHAERIDVRHVLVGKDRVVLGGDVIR
jgi:hypothetical protein